MIVRTGHAAKIAALAAIPAVLAVAAGARAGEVAPDAAASSGSAAAPAPPLGEPAPDASAAAVIDEAPPRGPLFHPEGPGRYRLRVAVGAQVDVLSSRVVESETRTIPEITARARFGLPYGFSADARLAAIVIANELSVGPMWSIRTGDVTLGVHDRVAFWYGALGTSLGVQGFDARGWGFLDYPGVSIGVPYRDSRFALTIEVIVVISQNVALGDAPHLGRRPVSIAGQSAMLTVDNLLPGGGDWYYGAGVISAVPDYAAWVAFSDSRARYPYPRFLAGYAF